MSEQSTIEVMIDPMKCQGYGLCMGVAPEIFDMPGGSPIAVVMRPLTDADRQLLADAERACPAQAITING